MINRATTMFLCSEIVKVCWRSTARGSKVLTANLEEISRYGATLVSEEPLPADAEVDIACQNFILRGKTSKSMWDEIGYSTWVEFQLDSQWSPDWFRPRHLLNLKALTPQYNHAA